MWLLDLCFALYFRQHCQIKWYGVKYGAGMALSMALGVAGGGEIAVDMSDQAGTTAVEGVFQLELALPPSTPVAGIGERVYVRLLHGSESLWQQWSRGIRQLLLSHLQT